MTFKSIDFFESPVMRSLEKIAVKNGLVKNDPLDKYAKAEKKFDLTPSKNLDENILKFCAALRKEGYDKLALEVEQNFVLYKQAESEYSKILNEAHPDGSHDLEGVLGDNEIEDLLAQHSKILNVVNKKPTGKTASSKDLINAVKIVLAQENKAEELRPKYALQQVKLATGPMMKAENIVKTQISTVFKDFSILQPTQEFINRCNSANESLMTNDFLVALLNLGNAVSSALNSWTRKLLDYTSEKDNVGVNKNKVIATTYINTSINLINYAIRIVKGEVDQDLLSAEEAFQQGQKNVEKRISDEETVKSKLLQVLSTQIARLNKFKLKINSSKIDDDSKSTANEWLDAQIAESNYLLNEVKNTTIHNENNTINQEIVKQLSNKINKIFNENNQFYNEWIK